MKKIVAALAGLSLCAAAATAEGITFGSWGRGLWNVIANSQEKDGSGYDDTIVSGIMQSWGPYGSPRTAIKARGDSENVGYALDVYYNGSGGISVGDDAHIYVKPIEQIRAYIGQTDLNVLRGDVCLPLWGWDRIGAIGTDGEEGWTFADYLDIGLGTSIIVTPIEGLTIGVAVTLPDDAGKDIGVVWGGDKGGKDGNSNYGGRYVAAYSIDGIGTIKAAFDTRRKHVRGGGWVDGEPYIKGVKESDENKYELEYDWTDDSFANKIDGDVMEIGAAFDLTAVENLFASIGAVIPTDGKEIKVNLGAHYQLDALGIYALVGTKINAIDWDSKSGWKTDGFQDDAGKFGIRAGVAVDYTLENGIGFFGEVQFANDVWMGYNPYAGHNGDWYDNNVTFGVGVTKGFSNGVMGIAFEGSTTGNRYTLEGDKFGFEVPVKFEYWF